MSMRSSHSLLIAAVMLVVALPMLLQAFRHHFSPAGGILALAAAALTAFRLGDIQDAVRLAIYIVFPVSVLLYVLSYRSAIRKGTFRGPISVVTGKKSMDDLRQPGG